MSTRSPSPSDDGTAVERSSAPGRLTTREQWLLALAEISTVLLSGETDDVLAVVAERVVSLVDAERVSIVVPDEADPALLRYRTVRGVGAAALQGKSRPHAGTLAGEAIESGQAVSADHLAADRYFPGQDAAGPTVAVPLVIDGRTIGALTVARSTSQPTYTEDDLDMAAEFAAQASIAMELATARADRQRLALADERARIARDLHDHVIQRLFGAGLGLQAIAGRTDAAVAAGIRDQVGAIDGAIAEIRTAVFALQERPGGAGAQALRHRVLDAVTQVGGVLPTPPRLTFSGAVDLLVEGTLADDVVAVVREAVANVVRHAHAVTATVEVAARGDEVVVTVIDDGIGIPATPTRSSGTANLSARARERGGLFTVGEDHPGTERPGTRLRWSAPITEEADGR